MRPAVLTGAAVVITISSLPKRIVSGGGGGEVQIRCDNVNAWSYSDDFTSCQSFTCTS